MKNIFCRLFLIQQLFAWFGAVLALGAAQERDKRPNIFFFFADDWGRYAGVYKENPVNQLVNTPAIDRVGLEGVRFTNAHVNAPSCTPSRSALFSGQYFYRTGRGAILRPAIWDESIPTFPLLLEKSGYFIGHTYKAWGPGVPANAPFGAKRTQFTGAGNRFNRFSQNVTKLVAKGGNPDAAKEQIYKECIDNFEAFLAKRRATPEDATKPFCYYFGPTNTHRAWEKGSGKALWNLDPEKLKGRMPKFLPDVPEVRQDFCDYLGEVLALDAVLERFIAKLEAMGELDNTVIVLSGDHGIPGFPRAKCNLYNIGTEVALLVRWGDKVKGGRAVDDFINLMDLAPTFLEIGGEKPPACMTGRSILPLLLSDKNGQVDPARDYVITGRERHVERARADLTPYPQRAIRTKDFLYIRNFKPERWPAGDPYAWNAKKLPENFAEKSRDSRYAFADMDASPTKTWLMLHGAKPEWIVHWKYAFGKRPAEELYDLRTDPDCLVNVATDADYDKRRQTLAARMMEVLAQTNDPRATNGGGMFENPPFAGPGTEEIRKPR
ncbi:N-sulfoglucosamine sulfohydrolase [Ereboglobus sp. PH5-5]|uniref:sulfatase family protein n=1 Tax=Ereboglobus sp. PH5-5 TaxID=2940529 RepID=UPI0024064CD4|nr:sulfatase [Ereboglobus sp. PH5-5]MDF9834056.1 N-sulfoglucosamine sulfohydrolase [Ereboglobus sp. PH5-5]